MGLWVITEHGNRKLMKADAAPGGVDQCLSNSGKPIGISTDTKVVGYGTVGSGLIRQSGSPSL